MNCRYILTRMVEQCVEMSLIFVRVICYEVSYYCFILGIFFNFGGIECNVHRFVIYINNLKQGLIKRLSKIGSLTEGCLIRCILALFTFIRRP